MITLTILAFILLFNTYDGIFVEHKFPINFKVGNFTVIIFSNFIVMTVLILVAIAAAIFKV